MLMLIVFHKMVWICYAWSARAPSHGAPGFPTRIVVGKPRH
jgi:hypothetical protein